MTMKWQRFMCLEMIERASLISMIYSVTTVTPTLKIQPPRLNSLLRPHLLTILLQRLRKTTQHRDLRKNQYYCSKKEEIKNFSNKLTPETFYFFIDDYLAQLLSAVGLQQMRKRDRKPEIVIILRVTNLEMLIPQRNVSIKTLLLGFRGKRECKSQRAWRTPGKQGPLNQYD